MSHGTLRSIVLRTALACAAFGAFPSRLAAQGPAPLVTGAADPDSLATLVMRTFESGTPEAFAAIFPDSAGRVFMRTRAPKQAALARVIWRDSSRAVLLLAGTTKSGDGGTRTNNARHFSGFYSAAKAGGLWTVTHKIPFDSANYIRSQAITVDIVPNSGITVVDTLTIGIGAPYGFGFRINSDVAFRSVRLNGQAVTHAFGGGVVWFPAPKTPSAQLVLEYTLAADSVARATPRRFGAFHNTDMWHPAFDYISANHLAQLSITARIPAEYHLTTTVPQTVTIENGVRTVRGSSMHHAFLLALIFDRDWQPRTTAFGTFRFESFTTPAFRHSHDTLAARTKHVYDLLTRRFGEPQFPSRYLAAVENRALGASGGFNVRMNNAAISAGGGGASLGSENGQIFAHETGHAWTMNSSGRASNFLHEAWAKFVESIVLRDLFGPDAETNYWEAQRNSYMVGNDRGGWQGGFEGRQSILGDFDNGRIHYMKGSWILRGATWVMGDSIFDLGMRHYIDGMGHTPGGYEELIAGWSKAAGRDMASFVMPWLTSRYIPDIDARVEGQRLIVTQRQPGETFELPKLEIQLTTRSGKILRTLDLLDRADTIALGNVGPVTLVHIDPNHRYLIQRRLGEVVRYELPASKVPGATSVSLASNFLRQGVTLPASLIDDMWVVEVPLTEGRYIHVWTAGGAEQPSGRAGGSGASDPDLTGARVVRALIRVENPYPGR